ncbi:MAG TPA: multidrug efflux SMR transporter [Verrucomicrobiae bacterium]|nr:multidrug efflux SMR transporter [Verrucomicrobiae bacterium]
MAWIYLFIAGLMEIGWPIGLKISQSPGQRITGLAFSVVCMACSGFFLWLAQKTIPMGTAYAVWTGIGTVGAFGLGILIYGEPKTALRFVSAGFILMGIIGLKLSHHPG